MYRRILVIALIATVFGAGYFAGSVGPAITSAGPLAQADCHTFPETGKTVCGRFWAYWQSHGGLAQQGYPISGEFKEISDLNGKQYTVQYFERAVFEYHPENQPPNDVLLSQLGTFQYRRKYGNGTSPSPTPQPAPSATPAQPQPVTQTDIETPVERDGVSFVVDRVDMQYGRVDVIFRIGNRTGGPLQLTLKNSDQTLYDGRAAISSPDIDSVTSVTLANGQEYNGGTAFFDKTSLGKGYTYEIRNLPRIGTVRVLIPPAP